MERQKTRLERQILIIIIITTIILVITIVIIVTIIITTSNDNANGNENDNDSDREGCCLGSCFGRRDRYWELTKGFGPKCPSGRCAAAPRTRTSKKRRATRTVWEVAKVEGSGIVRVAPRTRKQWPPEMQPSC